MAKKKIENITFEDSLAELTNIVNQLEEGDVNLAGSMTLFERGLQLSQHSQHQLNDAEQKIAILLSKNGEKTLSSFESSES